MASGFLYSPLPFLPLSSYLFLLDGIYKCPYYTHRTHAPKTAPCIISDTVFLLYMRAPFSAFLRKTVSLPLIPLIDHTSLFSLKLTTLYTHVALDFLPLHGR